MLMHDCFELTSQYPLIGVHLGKLVEAGSASGGIAYWNNMSNMHVAVYNETNVLRT